MLTHRNGKATEAAKFPIKDIQSSAPKKAA
jgi:hypothetical protein